MIINSQKNYFGLLLVAAGLGLMAYTAAAQKAIMPKEEPFSQYGMLAGTWQRYKEGFISSNGRVIYEEGTETATSEGQSYGMLRAVIIDDKETFDKVWKWTLGNMKRPQDNLFGWKYGKISATRYGFIVPGGINTATDADSDIALSLILAARRWGDDKYLDEANKILDDLWKLEVAEADGKRYLSAGAWANTETEVTINPSYWSPYAWRIFAEVNENDWESLIDPAYEKLFESLEVDFDKNRTAGLPPDWMVIDKKTGRIKAPGNNLSTNYSFDAIRVPFRISMDYKWFGEKRAKEYLDKAMKKLVEDYKERKIIAAEYSNDGKTVTKFENPAMYATSLAYFAIVDEKMAKEIYMEKIAYLYSNDTNGFRGDLPYYEQNWLWLGAANYFDLFNNFEPPNVN